MADDPFIRRYEKLVRDKMPEIYASDGYLADIEVLDADGFREATAAKLYEELAEVVGAETRQDRVEELGDLLTVMEAYCDAHDINWWEVTAAAIMKIENRGAFKKRLFLLELG